MRYSNDSNERLISAGVADYMAGASDPGDVWGKVCRRLLDGDRRIVGGRGPRFHAMRRASVAVALVLGGAFAGGTGAIVARGAVPFLGDNAATGITVSASGVVGVHPTPNFPIYNPAYLPANLTVRTFADIPGRQPGGKFGWTAITSNCSPVTDATCPSAASPPTALQTTGTPSVWMLFSAPAPRTDYLQIVEQAADSSAPAPGPVTMVNGTPVTVQQSGAEAVLRLSRAGTAITIRTNLPQSDGLRVAGSLH